MTDIAMSTAMATAHVQCKGLDACEVEASSSLAMWLICRAAVQYGQNSALKMVVHRPVPPVRSIAVGSRPKQSNMPTSKSLVELPTAASSRNMARRGAPKREAADEPLTTMTLGEPTS